MAAKTDAVSPTEMSPKLVKDLAARMRGSLLPGEVELGKAELEEAARFLLATANKRGKDAGLTV